MDILNPVQTSAANMEPEMLKAEFGDQLVFWGGGCDTQSVLTNATIRAVFGKLSVPTAKELAAEMFLTEINRRRMIYHCRRR